MSDALELLRSRLFDPRLSLELRECFLERFLSRDRERERVFDLERLLFRREGDLLLERDRERLREYERPRDFERDLEREREREREGVIKAPKCTIKPQRNKYI